jgi:uncharacterized protein YgbK (DUF1537 family)
LLRDGPLVAFYGDDFTGSSASMEVLAFAGLPTVLFLDLPGAPRIVPRISRDRHRRRCPRRLTRLDG